MNKVLEEIVNNGCVKSPNGDIIEIHSHIDFGQGEFLQQIITKIGAEVSIEVGLAYGISALFICDSLIKTSNTCHIVIDPYQFTDWKGIGFNNLKMAGYDNFVEFHNLPSHIALAQLETRKLNIDFAFIDGYHTFDYALIDFFYIDRILRTGGIVVLDDVGMKGIKKLCKYIFTNRSYSLIGYWGSLQGATPKGFLSKLIKFILTPFLNNKRVEAFVKIGLFRGIRCIAFKKEAEDKRHGAYHHNF